MCNTVTSDSFEMGKNFNNNLEIQQHKRKHNFKLNKKESKTLMDQIVSTTRSERERERNQIQYRIITIIGLTIKIIIKIITVIERIELDQKIKVFEIEKSLA